MGLTVYTGGTFDLIHPGHLSLLAACRRLSEGGNVVVSLNTDEFVEAYKGHRPVMPYDDRAAVLRALRWVDQVIPNVGGADSKPAIEIVRPDLIVIGADWRDRDYHAQMQFTPEWLHERGISLVYVDLLPDRSSSRLRETASWTMGSATR